MHSSPNKCFAACFLLKSWIQNFQGASFLDPLELGAWFGKGKGRAKTFWEPQSRAGSELLVSGEPAPGRPGQERVPACPRTPHPCVTPLASQSRERLQSSVLLWPGKARGSCSPGSPCPVGHSQSCPGDTGMQAGKGEGGKGEPTGRGSGVSGSPAVPSHTGDS